MDYESACTGEVFLATRLSQGHCLRLLSHMNPLPKSDFWKVGKDLLGFKAQDNGQLSQYDREVLLKI